MTDNIKSLVKRLRKAVELYDTLMSTVTGCTDGGCMIRTPQGMHTNGGCRCHRDSMKTQRVLYSAKQLREALNVDAIECFAAPVADSAMAKDAEAFRLMAKHRLLVGVHLDESWAQSYGTPEGKWLTIKEPNGDDACAAARRAIDRAVAAIAASAEKGA